MKVMIDGEYVECKNNVKIIHEIWDDAPKELHLTHTSEGQVIDVVEEDGSIDETCWADLSHLTEDCH